VEYARVSAYSVNFQRHRQRPRDRIIAVISPLSLEIRRTAISEARHNADLYDEIRANAGYRAMAQRRQGDASSGFFPFPLYYGAALVKRSFPVFDAIPG